MLNTIILNVHHKLKLEEGLVKAPISGQMSILDLKKFRPISKTKSLIPRAIFDISKRVNISQLKVTDYIGRIETEEYGEMEKWQKKDIGYLVKTEDFIEKMNRQLPKPDALMDKVLKILIYLIQQEANKSGKDITEAEISFYSKDIAGYLGLGEQIKKSGEFNKSLKRTLISGHCTHYEYPHKIDGVNYRYYGTFFDVDIPEDSKHKWTLYFNGLFRKEIIEFVNTGRVQYLKHYLKEIADTYTGKKQYLHFFYNQMIYSNLSKRAKKIGNILKDMGIIKYQLDRPKECFKILKDCLIYFREQIEGFYISKYQYESKTEIKDKLFISISEAFKKYEYEDFKGLLKAIGIKDIREAYISFKRPFTKLDSSKYKLTGEDKKLRDDILEWTKEWEKLRNYSIEKTEEERRKYIDDRIGKLGCQLVEDLFEEEKDKKRPSAYHFLFCTLTGREDDDMDWDYY